MIQFKRDWFWPILEPLSIDQQRDDDKLTQSIKTSIINGNWSESSDAALEEARRLFDAEVDRRKGADAKAGIYLAAITALIPVLVSLLPNLWGDKINKVLGFISLIVFTGAVAYLLTAGAWAFRTLKVAGFAQIGPGEVADCWKKPLPTVQLAKQLARAALYNYPLGNRKVDGIKMTHEYLLRAFLSFTLLMVIQITWPVGAWVVEEITKFLKPEIAHPLIMCFS
ncbi:hypothetical protein HUS91_31110 [Pseudomonas chlororaphis]|uniref:hypothetical protein n=1 Tax=Pseudomonas chlororaphis TaxID=587753 RepID=UPI001B343FF5|nr:hypothetical protein [Pseudomonas chlororaphis]MBP5089925.1 hypothetical protein [Pseudomonas chlororaphis]